jgi:carotenoid phi-ring synthase / carotenoid chi-ring synthase
MPDQDLRPAELPAAASNFSSGRAPGYSQSSSGAWGGQQNISRAGRDRGLPPAIEKIMMKINHVLHGLPPFLHSDVGRAILPPVTKGLARLPEGEIKRVVIVGAGIGGLITALELAKLGYTVDIYESNDFLGGRLGGKYLATAPSGVWEHGLHHLFVNVYDFLMQKLEEVGADRHLEVVDSVYLHFETYQNETLRIQPNAHLLNLIGILIRSPNVNLFDAIKSLPGMIPVFFYNHQQVIAKYDHLTMTEYAEKTGISKTFYDTFIKTILTVSINRMTNISAAQVLQLMWVFFLCRPDAMRRAVPTDNHYISIFVPFVNHLEKLGVKIHTSKPVAAWELAPGKIQGIKLADGTRVSCDYLVMATDVQGTKNILQQTKVDQPNSLSQLQPVLDRVAKIKIAPPYIVARAYFLEKPNNPDLPDVVETPENQPVDLVFQPHKTEKQEAKWVQEALPGEERWILEVHAYDLGPSLFSKYGDSTATSKSRTENQLTNDQLTDDQLWELIQSLSDEQIWEVMKQSVSTIDGMENMAIAKMYPIGGLQLRRYYNFTGFQIGQADRPSAFFAEKQYDNLFFVGDWLAIQGKNGRDGQPGAVHPGGNLLGQVASIAGITAGLIAAQDGVVGPSVPVV